VHLFINQKNNNGAVYETARLTRLFVKIN